MNRKQYLPKLILTTLFTVGVTNAQVTITAGEYRVQVHSVSDVFKAEAVATKLIAELGVEVYVAF